MKIKKVTVKLWHNLGKGRDRWIYEAHTEDGKRQVIRTSTREKSFALAHYYDENSGRYPEPSWTFTNERGRPERKFIAYTPHLSKKTVWGEFKNVKTFWIHTEEELNV